MFRKTTPWQPHEDALLRDSIATHTCDELAVKLNRSPQAVRSRANRLGFALRTHRRERAEQDPLYLPTPEEIASECAKIRESWDDREEQSRIVGANAKRIAFMPPTSNDNPLADLRWEDVA